MQILRAFLGGTFLFAGIQKLGDPNFFHSGSPDYIGSQLAAFAQGSPIKPLLSLAGHVPILAGLAVALTEVAVGLGTLLGVAPMSFAAIGALTNVVLFLSATWHVQPYFLGSDSIYAVAWIAYLVGLIEARRRDLRVARSRGSRHQRRARHGEIDRRAFVRGALVALGSFLVGAAAFSLEGREVAVADPPSPPAPSPATASPSTTARHRSPPPKPSGRTIATLDELPVGDAVGFSDPAAGPSVLVRLAKDQVVAFSRTCTHAGCLVQYDAGSKLLICPCHGAEFDVTHGAVPVAGPAPTPLASIKVAIDEATGQVLAED
jgi:thiosulfate dehydrogenase [quinone] large subunit